MHMPAWCLAPVRLLSAILYPWRSDAQDSPAALRWCLHLLLWTSLIAGLWYVNHFAGLERSLRSPWPALHGTWLPLIGVVAYLLGWFARALWLSLRRDVLPGAWPDLESAWCETRFALEQAKIPLADTPVFLVLGPLTAELQAFMKSQGASALTLRANAPVRVFAQREAVFIVCDCVSHLGLKAEPAVGPAWSDSFAGETSARLEHLCRLLSSERGVQPTIQGIALAVPFSAMQTDADTRVLIGETQNDLSVVRKATGLETPLFVVVNGLDFAANSSWFQRFPAHPDLDPADIPAMLQSGVDWLCLERIFADLRGQFRLATEFGAIHENLHENVRLVHQLGVIRAWRTRLKEFLIEGTQNDFSDPGMVVGCYILSTDDATSAAPALGHDLLAHRQAATWTAETLTALAEQRRQAWLGYGVGLLGTCAALAWISWILAIR